MVLGFFASETSTTTKSQCAQQRNQKPVLSSGGGCSGCCGYAVAMEYKINKVTHCFRNNSMYFITA